MIREIIESVINRVDEEIDLKQINLKKVKNEVSKEMFKVAKKGIELADVVKVDDEFYKDFILITNDNSEKIDITNLPDMMLDGVKEKVFGKGIDHKTFVVYDLGKTYLAEDNQGGWFVLDPKYDIPRVLEQVFSYFEKNNISPENEYKKEIEEILGKIL